MPPPTLTRPHPIPGASPTIQQPSRIFGTGEMADLVRAFNWSSTPVGPIDSWRDPLLTCVNLLLSSNHPMFLWWGPDHIQFYNDAYRPSFGVGKHPTALGQPGKICWSEIWDEYIVPRLDLVTRLGQPTWYENQLVPIFRNGTIEDVYWTWSDSPIRDAHGNIVGVLVTCAETTARVLADRELNRNRDRLQLALEAAELGTWTYNPADETFTADERMQQMFGAPVPTGDHDFWQRILHPDDRLAAREEFAAALAGTRTYNLDYRVLHPDGLRWIRSKGKVLTAEDGSKSMFAIVEDITDRKVAEIELRDRARELRESHRIGKMGSWRNVLATNTLTWSEEVYNLLDHDPTLPVLNFAVQPEIMEPDSLRRLEAAVANCIATGRSYELDTKMYLPSSGRAIWLATRGEAVFDSSGKVIELRGTVRDITERMLAEEALRRTEKLAVVGRLAASIAHEINNPLESLTNLLYLASRADTLDHAREFLTLADAELRRASAITSQTLRFHRQSTRATQVTADDLIDNTLANLRSRIANANVSVEKSLRATRPILCFDGEIRQVISNLLINAIDAMQLHGGRLILRTREHHPCHSCPTQSSHCPLNHDRSSLVLTIADTGTGMSPETRAKIFEPFYTTKGESGTGLGLWISKEIIDRHNGRLRVRTSQHPHHHGTVFTLFLPFDTPAPDPPIHPSP